MKDILDILEFYDPPCAEFCSPQQLETIINVLEVLRGYMSHPFNFRVVYVGIHNSIMIGKDIVFVYIPFSVSCVAHMSMTYVKSDTCSALLYDTGKECRVTRPVLREVLERDAHAAFCAPLYKGGEIFHRPVKIDLPL